ncbi:glycosyltransferase family 4 protein [Thiofaba sp. EF100]|uniref:glycosyltransferase family 4 protein n=1 Tax=Thiofaba sp. EF100 TaxID=3121274 RepID=UPI003221BC50
MPSSAFDGPDCRLRLVQIIAGDGRGGADRIALALGRAMSEAGHRVDYVVKPAFLRYHDLAALGHVTLDYPRGLRGLRAFNRAVHDADVVLTHDSGSRHLGLRAKLLGMRPPLWFMRHCISGTSRLGGVQLHRWLVARQIAISEAVAQSLIASSYPAARVHLIHAGVDLFPFAHPDPQAVERLRAQWLPDRQPGEMVLGMVARFGVYPGWSPDKMDLKGYDVLFAALAKVSFPYRVLILGPRDEPDHAALRQMAAYHGADPEQLVFTGFVQDVAPYYALMDINVLPSRGEGLGLGAIEGMAAGVVTVVSASGGLGEVMRNHETGLSFPEGDAQALAACLERLAADAELRRSLGQSGQADVLARFGLERMARAVDDLMQTYVRKAAN